MLRAWWEGLLGRLEVFTDMEQRVQALVSGASILRSAPTLRRGTASRQRLRPHRQNRGLLSMSGWGGNKYHLALLSLALIDMAEEAVAEVSEVSVAERAVGTVTFTPRGPPPRPPGLSRQDQKHRDVLLVLTGSSGSISILLFVSTATMYIKKISQIYL